MNDAGSRTEGGEVNCFFLRTSTEREKIPPPCWEHQKCDESVRRNCPAAKHLEVECWKLTGTRCDHGLEAKASLSEKILHCRNNCQYYRTFFLGRRQRP